MCDFSKPQFPNLKGGNPTHLAGLLLGLGKMRVLFTESFLAVGRVPALCCVICLTSLKEGLPYSAWQLERATFSRWPQGTIPCPWAAVGWGPGGGDIPLWLLCSRCSGGRLELPVFMAVPWCSASRLFYGSLFLEPHLGWDQPSGCPGASVGCSGMGWPPLAACGRRRLGRTKAVKPGPRVASHPEALREP